MDFWEEKHREKGREEGIRYEEKCFRCHKQHENWVYNLPVGIR